MNTDEQTNKPTVQRTQWKTELTNVFIENLNTEDIDKLTDKLTQLHQEIGNTNQTVIDEVAKDLRNIFFDSASKSGLTKKVKRNNKPRTKMNKMQWFDGECRLRRRLFRKAKRRSKLNPQNNQLRNERNKEFKEYRKTVTSKHNKHRYKLQKDLRNMKTKNTSEYWTVLNKAIDELNETEAPTVEDLRKHFENLGKKQKKKLYLHEIQNQ